MKHKFENIEDLFKESFEKFEADVDPNMWSKISSQIGQNAPVQDPSSAASGSSGSAAAGSGIVKVAMVAGTAGIISVGSYLVFSDDEPLAEAELNVIPQTEAISEESSLTNSLEEAPVAEEKENFVVEDFSDNQTIESKEEEYEVLPIDDNQELSEAIIDEDDQSTVVAVSKTEEKSVAKPKEDNHEPEAAKTSRATKATVVSPAMATIEKRFEASIYASVKQGVSPLTVNFENRGSHSHEASWDFGDGSFPSTEINPEHVFEKSGQFWVILEINNEKGQKSRDSVLISVNGNVVFSAGNIFTPNGDGLNDAFVIETENVQSLNCQIMDRSGNMIFQWSNLYGHWDGTNMQGQQVPVGTYYFIATGVDSQGQPLKPLKGTVTLNR